MDKFKTKALFSTETDKPLKSILGLILPVFFSISDLKGHAMAGNLYNHFVHAIVFLFPPVCQFHVVCFHDQRQVPLGHQRNCWSWDNLSMTYDILRRVFCDVKLLV